MIARWSSAALLLLLATAPALAEDTIVETQHCNAMCKLRRNLTGRAEIPPPSPAENNTVPEPLPEATDGAGPPDINRLVAHRGVVMEESPADRAATRRQRARLERELKASPTLVVPTNGQGTTAQH